MSARRPLLTAAAAGSLLCALWFVPSANATVEDPGSSSATSHNSPSSGAGTEAVSDGDPTGTGSDGNLADTGSMDVTPYLFGGTAFLGLGVAMVTASVRRTRPEAD